MTTMCNEQLSYFIHTKPYMPPFNKIYIAKLYHCIDTNDYTHPLLIAKSHQNMR